jgi:hypothetical protein
MAAKQTQWTRAQARRVIDDLDRCRDARLGLPRQAVRDFLDAHHAQVQPFLTTEPAVYTGIGIGPCRLRQDVRVNQVASVPRRTGRLYQRTRHWEAN